MKEVLKSSSDLFITYPEVKMINSKTGEKVTGVRIRPAQDDNGYYVEALGAKAFITEETYQAIKNGEPVEITC